MFSFKLDYIKWKNGRPYLGTGGNQYNCLEIELRARKSNASNSEIILADMGDSHCQTKPLCNLCYVEQPVRLESAITSSPCAIDIAIDVFN